MSNTKHPITNIMLDLRISNDNLFQINQFDIPETIYFSPKILRSFPRVTKQININNIRSSQSTGKIEHKLGWLDWHGIRIVYCI